ncbi:unknown protein [Simkania negevensis Z]|uniref:Uncharacterized protein n=1 Tax=Simkania negevensis (strain ATCC VR-1471 / DSM 27360 / Z) TaxID=331113 RepID=F8L375_SIMNZ|nr:unknown protein [Simkania negevensis Z]
MAFLIGVNCYETHLSTKQTSTQEDPWISCSHEDEKRKISPQTQTSKGT